MSPLSALHSTCHSLSVHTHIPYPFLKHLSSVCVFYSETLIFSVQDPREASPAIAIKPKQSRLNNTMSLVEAPLMILCCLVDCRCSESLSAETFPQW
jgi:hypothetical protein